MSAATQPSSKKPTPEEATREFVASVLAVPWGRLSKYELEFLIFKLLVERNTPEMQGDDLSIATALQTTTTKVRNLFYQFNQRRSQSMYDNWAQIAKQANIIFPNDEQGVTVIQLQNGYLLDVILNEFQTRWATAVPVIAGHVIKVDTEKFLKTLIAKTSSAGWNNNVVTLRTQLHVELAKDAKDRKFAHIKEKAASLLTFMAQTAAQTAAKVVASS